MGSSATHNEPANTLGRIEKVDFPEWDLVDIDAKVDTGAYTSSLHCHHIEKVRKEGEELVRFNLLDPTHETYNERLFELPVHKEKTIRSSNGVEETRFIVKTKIRIAGKLYDVELSLTDRSEMKNPVLLGRRLLKNRFVVDVSRKHITQNTNKND